MATTVLMTDQFPIAFLKLVASTVDPSSAGFLLFSWRSKSLTYYIGSKAYDVVLVVDLFFSLMSFLGWKVLYDTQTPMARTASIPTP